MRSNIQLLNNWFETFAKRHKLINYYINASNAKKIPSDIKYPLLWVSFNNVVLDGGSVEIDVEVNSFDRLTEDDSNYMDVAGTTLTIINDFIRYHVSNEEKFNFTFDEEISLEPTVGVWDDRVAGWTGTIKAGFRNDVNETEIPLEDE